MVNPRLSGGFFFGAFRAAFGLQKGGVVLVAMLEGDGFVEIGILAGLVVIG